MVMSENEISVTTEGITLKGAVVEDVRPPIRRAGRIVDQLGRLAENVVALTVGYLNNNFERVLAKYPERFEEIPLERRQDPPLRLAYAVVRTAAESADEPEIQDMFATLLASGSDSAKAPRVHPGFATVIGEMVASDARVLVAVGNLDMPFQVRDLVSDRLPRDVVERAVSNLVRLGLVEWQTRPYTRAEIEKLSEVRGGGVLRFMQQRDPQSLIRDIEKDIGQLKKDMLLQAQSQQRVLVVTDFGDNFLATATKRATG